MDFDLQNGAQNEQFSRALFIFEPLGADFGPIPTKNGSETSFGMLFAQFWMPV